MIYIIERWKRSWSGAGYFEGNDLSCVPRAHGIVYGAAYGNGTFRGQLDESLCGAHPLGFNLEKN